LKNGSWLFSIPAFLYFLKKKDLKDYQHYELGLGFLAIGALSLR